MTDTNTEYKVKAPKKLIEVALPLKEINEACIREKSIRHGHPSTLHLYWARRPLAAARAVLFAQLVNDPGWDEDLQIGYKRKADANRKREELFEIIRELVKWENTNNELVLEKAQAEIRKSWMVTCELNKDHPQAAELFDPDKLPAFHDPFAGGGSIPLEAQRLGLEAWASDLNPVAVLINKAMIEIPPKFVGHRPIGPIPENEKQIDTENYTWPGLTGLAEDVRRWGHWVREEAFKKIGHLYPPIEITEEMTKERLDLLPYKGKKLTVIAYIWARTVKSPNPLYSHVDVPLASTFLLSDKKGKEAWIEPVINGDQYEFKVRHCNIQDITKVKQGTKLPGRSSNFLCLLSNTPIDGKYIKAEGQAGRMATKLMAIVCEGKKGRVYISPDRTMEDLAFSAIPHWKPEQLIEGKNADQAPLYGMKVYGDLFTARQLATLNELSYVITQVRDMIPFYHQREVIHKQSDADTDGNQITFADSIVTYLSLAIDRIAMTGNSLVRWNSVGEKAQHCFGRQALPMLWDFAEPNPFSNATGSIRAAVFYTYDPLNWFVSFTQGFASQLDATNQEISDHKIISTDPPYYDNICYADLSDMFYVWLRKSLLEIYPDLFSTISTPKDNEIIASPYRHKNKAEAELFFLDNMKKAVRMIANQFHKAFPITIYYAFKQSETSNEGTISAGWVTFLSAIIHSGLIINGTWPIHTEMKTRQIAMGTNALASSIVLVCQKRDINAIDIGRKNFLIELSHAIPIALDTMINGSETSSPIAPVDLAQAAIGPGMAVFSKYKSILEADGSPMTVQTALILINKAIDDYFKELEGDWDSDTRFCMQWFSEYGWKEGMFGEAEVLAKAKGISVEGVKDSGVLFAGGGKVRLYRPADYPEAWNPAKDSRMPIWEVLHQLIRAHQSKGEAAAAKILTAVPHASETARQLAFLLYTMCERKGWAEDARPYNDLVTAWLSIEKQAREEEQSGQIEAEF